ncbi:MAG: aldehyde ferredoxin oxidoreductase family protein [Peptococcaceae bacterium]|nr:aldehyde ferredoxin oxidoreductase family protein [Peptococcaceae bacterium]
MNYRGGYAGQILRIDLSTGKVEKVMTPVHLATGFIGGRGLSSYFLWKEVGPGVSPYDPENLLIFAAGPLNGTPLPSSGRLTVAAKSPMTGILGDANAGGYWAPELKWAGYDGIIIRGKADHPVYIWIDDDKVTIREAFHLWGKTVEETCQTIKEELDDEDIRIACIGPGGERLVRYACVITDGEGAAGRCGIGAVMGSKMLKAIAVRGTRGVRIADPSGFKKAVDQYLENIKNDVWLENLTQFGTPNLVVHRQKLGLWGAKNFQDDLLDDWENISPERLTEGHLVRILGCLGCVVRCRRYSRASFGKYGTCYTKGPEYDTINALAAKTGITDYNAVIYAHHVCDQLGIDAQSAGSSIAMAMELYERGILKDNQVSGLDMRFGNSEAMVEALFMIARREGIGDLLAEGCKVMGERLGAGYFAAHVKGLEIDATDPRRYVTRALTYSVATRGSCHLRGYPYIDEFITREEAEKWFGEPEVSNLESLAGKGKMIAWSEDWVTLADLFGICKFAWYRSRKFNNLIVRGVEIAGNAFRAATGLELGGEDLLRCGERVYNVERLFNNLQGMGRKDDFPPDRFFEEPLKRGPGKGIKLDREDYNKVLDEYYLARGWDSQGAPSPEKLRQLGLDGM